MTEQEKVLFNELTDKIHDLIDKLNLLDKKRKWYLGGTLYIDDNTGEFVEKPIEDNEND